MKSIHSFRSAKFIFLQDPEGAGGHSAQFEKLPGEPDKKGETSEGFLSGLVKKGQAMLGGAGKQLDAVDVTHFLSKYGTVREKAAQILSGPLTPEMKEEFNKYAQQLKVNPLVLTVSTKEQWPDVLAYSVVRDEHGEAMASRAKLEYNALRQMNPTEDFASVMARRYAREDREVPEQGKQYENILVQAQSFIDGKNWKGLADFATAQGMSAAEYSTASLLHRNNPGDFAAFLAKRLAGEAPTQS